MAMYGPTITEAKRVKGQEYDSIIYSRDASGNKIVSDPSDGVRYATTSTGKGGILDSVAQNHIQDLDVEKEKALLESKDFLNEYALYLAGNIRKAIEQYGDQSKSQMEKRMVEDLERLKPYFPDENKQAELIVDEYYGGKFISDDLSDEETTKILKTVLRLRLNYVNKITSLMSEMLKKNYKVFGLSEEQAKIYIDNLKSGDNKSTKAAGEVLQLIKKNGDKFLTNNGQSVDLRSLGFGVILGPSEGYELGFLGTDWTNKDAMLNLVQSAIRYDAVLIAHGSNDVKNDDSETNSILDALKKADKLIHKDHQMVLKKVESLSKDDRQDIYTLTNIYKQICTNDYMLEIDGIDTAVLNGIDDAASQKDKVSAFKSLILKVTNKFYNEDDFKDGAIQLYKNSGYGQETIDEILKVYNTRKDIIIAITKMTFIEMLISIVKGTIIEQDDKFKGDVELYWSCQPTRTLKAGPFEDVNELVRQLIKEGYKKILIKDCNPGGHQLAEDIMKTKGVIINHSDFSNFVESSFDNDPDSIAINEAELSLKEFAESYGIDYNDDAYLEECCNWYLENYELIEEANVDTLKEFFKRILTAIIGFFKWIFGLVKKAFRKLKSLFTGTKDEPKDTKTEFQKPIKTKLIDIKDKKVVEITSNTREDLSKQAGAMCSKLADEVKKFNQKQQSSLKKIESDIDKLSRKEVTSNKESYEVIESMAELLESGDLLDTINYFLEFEDANGVVPDDDGEDSDFSMEDDAGATPEPAAEETPEPTDEPEEEDFSMEDEGEGETQEEPEDASEEDEEEDFELPDEEGEGEDTPEGEEGEDEEFSMDDEGGDDTGGEPGEEPTSDEPVEDDNISPKLKELESVIFDNLTDEEKKLKIKDLKELYVTVYKKCGSITELLADVKKDEETIQIVEYISNTLLDLKHYVDDYLNDIFDSKTYVENLAQLQKYIMIFNAISKVFDQIKQENE